MTYNGGIMRFIPFNGHSWIAEFAFDGLHQPEVKIMLTVTVILVLSSVVLAAKCCGSLSAARRCNLNSEPRTSHRTYSSAESHRSNSSACNSLLLESNFEYDCSCAASDRKGSWKAAFIELTEVKVEQMVAADGDKTNTAQVDSGISSIQETSSEEQPQSFRDDEKEMFLKDRMVSSNRSVNKINKKTRSKWLIGMYILLIVSAIVYGSFFSFLLYRECRLVDDLFKLPAWIHRIAFTMGQLSRNFLDLTFSKICSNIRVDASFEQKSHLYMVAEQIKQIATEGTACLATKMCNPKNNSQKFDLFIPMKGNQSEIKRMKNCVSSLFKKQHLLVDHIGHLHDIAVAISKNPIEQIEISWNRFRANLFTALQHTNRRGYGHFVHSIKQDRDIVCQHMDEKAVGDCKKMDAFLEYLTTAQKSLPDRLPNKSLETVVHFTMIPKAFHADSLIKDWLPVLTDLNGSGLINLLEKYLRPAMKTLKDRIKHIVRDVPSESVNLTMTFYTYVVNSFLLTLCILSVLLEILLVSHISYIFFGEYTRVPDTYVSHNQVTIVNSHEESNITRRNSSRHRSLLLIQRVFPYGGRQLRTILMFATFILIITLGIVATLFGYAFKLLQADVCASLEPGLVQNQTDLVITAGIKRYLNSSETVRSFLRIPYLDFNLTIYPLATFSAKASNHFPSVFHSLNLDKMMNYTSVLNSDWLARQLHLLWQTWVGSRLATVKIPPIYLNQIFKQSLHLFPMEKSFDKLRVEPVEAYLIDPEPLFHSSICSKNMKHWLSRKTLSHISRYCNVSGSYQVYSNNFYFVKKLLREMDENKEIIKPLSEWIGNVSEAINNVQKLNNTDLVELFDQVITTGWPRIRPSFVEHVIPFMKNLLQDITPSPELKVLFNSVIQPFCLRSAVPHDASNLLNHRHQPFPSDLLQISISLFIMSWTTFIGCLISHVLLRL